MRQKRKELQGQIGKFIIIGGDCNSHLIDFGRPSRQKISEDIDDLKSITDKYDLTDT